MLTLKRSTLIGAGCLIAAGLITAAAAWQSSRADSTSKAANLKLDANRSLGAVRSYRNLTLIPVFDRSARSTGEFLTLDEGLKVKQVTVAESKSGGDVNTLYVTNRGKKPLYLMGGEVVLGGQQDRVVGRDVIVAAGRSSVPITVFCVEHGRWTGRSQFDQSAPTVASAEIRARAQDGEFYASREAAGLVVGNSNGSTDVGALTAGRRSQQASGARLPNRSAAASPVQSEQALAERTRSSGKIGESQQRVWDKVAEKNANLKTGSSTGTYRRALTLSAGDAQKSVPAYVTALSGSLGADPHLVGVVAAVNGKVVAADVFGDPALFHKLWPKLLRSYASDAVEHAAERSKPAAVTPGKAKAFLVRATDAKSRIENKSDVSSTVRYESSDAVSYTLVPGGHASGVGGGAFGGGSVHTGVLGK